MEICRFCYVLVYRVPSVLIEIVRSKKLVDLLSPEVSYYCVDCRY